MYNEEKRAVLTINITEKIQVVIKVKEDNDSADELQELFNATEDTIKEIVKDIQICYNNVNIK